MITIEVGERKLKFTYNLDGSGWATCILEINGQRLEFTASYLSDCLSDLLRSLMLLNPFCVPRDEARRESECEWERGKMDGIIWSFVLRENNRLNIKADYYEDEHNKEKTTTLINTEYPYDDFLRIVLKEIDALIKRHGIIGY